jgi:hypothetical protein
MQLAVQQAATRHQHGATHPQPCALPHWPQARRGPAAAQPSTNLASAAAWRQHPSGFMLPAEPSSSAGQGLRRSSSAASASSGETQPLAAVSGDVPLPAVHLQVRLPPGAGGCSAAAAALQAACCHMHASCIWLAPPACEAGARYEAPWLALCPAWKAPLWSVQQVVFC